MNFLKIYSEKTVDRFIKKRAGETKLGEAVQFVKNLGELNNCPAKYVLLGIPEDIGVRANYGNPGTAEAWEAVRNSFLNFQENGFVNSKNIILLGEIDCDFQMEQAKSINSSDLHYVEKLGELVSQIDHQVSKIIQYIISAGKFPIIIGGGHNNCYGILNGTSTALQKSINCINLDAHTDFRSLEQRHSGNGFSYAFEEGFLEKYFILGLHKNYTPRAIFDLFKSKSEKIAFTLYEDVSVSGKTTFSEALLHAETFCCDSGFGIEVDMDALEMMGSSAMSPTGFSLSEARKFVAHFSNNVNALYLHICEGSPKDGLFPNQVGKAISYLISEAIAEK